MASPRYMSLDLAQDTPACIMLAIVDQQGNVWARESLPFPPAQRFAVVGDDHEGRLSFLMTVHSFLSMDIDFLIHILDTSFTDEDRRYIIESLREQLRKTLKDRKDSSNECEVRTNESSQGHRPGDGKQEIGGVAESTGFGTAPALPGGDT